MPWDGTELWMADLGSDGYIANARYIAGGPEESLFQPEWSPTGELYVISDRTGWWNLYRVQDGELEPVYPIEAECGEPQWEFGYSTYAFVNARQVVVLSRDRGEDKLHLVDVADGQAEELDTQATSIKAYVSAANDQVAYIGGTARQVPAVRLRSGGGVTERAVTPPQHQRTTDKVKSPKRHWVPTHGRPPIPILLHPPAAPEQSDDSPVPYSCDLIPDQQANPEHVSMPRSSSSPHVVSLLPKWTIAVAPDTAAHTGKPSLTSGASQMLRTASPLPDGLSTSDEPIPFVLSSRVPALAASQRFAP